MSIFNEEQIKAMFSREYICRECGNLMKFEEEYENLYPTREEVLGIADEDEDDPDE